MVVYLGYQLTLAVPPAEDFTLKMTIEVANPNGSFNAVRPPVNGIGVSGGVWNFHQYDNLGIDKRYPIFVLSNATPPGYFLIHVKSNALRNYTLADFFNVWGEPLSPSYTLGIASQPSNGLSWSMCLGLPPNQRFGQWGNQTLTKDMFIGLLYANLDCGGA